MGAVNDAGKGNWAEEESSPLMLIEEEAVVNVLVIYYFTSQYLVSYMGVGFGFGREERGGGGE